MKLSEPLADWCASMIGAFAVVSDCSHPHGESQVWRLQATTDETYYLKAHRRSGKRDREIWAYYNVVPCFAGFAPRLVGVCESPSALLLSALPGEPMERVALTNAQEQDAWYRAGAVLCRYHGVRSAWFGRPDRNGKPQDGAQPDAQTFWQERFGDWLTRAEKGGYLSTDELDFAKRFAGTMDAFAGEPAVATHHDYTPRNWIVDTSGDWLGVIDFEHACFDVCVADFKLHHDRYFADRTDLQDAFFAGYGAPLSDRQRAQLRLIHLHQAVSGIVWAREHNDADFAATNAAILNRLRRE